MLEGHLYWHPPYPFLKLETVMDMDKAHRENCITVPLTWLIEALCIHTDLSEIGYRQEIFPCSD